MKLTDEIIIEAIKNGRFIKRKNREDRFSLTNSNNPVDILKYINKEDVFEDDWELACGTEEELVRKNLICNVIKALDKLKLSYPQATVIIETPTGMIKTTLEDTIIYEGMDNAIVIDSE